jgi:transcriptional regulator with XRE-family HTH domain
MSDGISPANSSSGLGARVDEAFGLLLRRWRTGARMSQQALARQIGCSLRHVSFIENGRSKPGRELVLRISDAFKAGPADRNRLLTLAGYSEEGRPVAELDADRAVLLRRYCDHVLSGVEPCPAAILDNRLRITRMNRMAAEIFAVAAPFDDVFDEGLYSFVLGALHPKGVRRIAVRWEPYAESLVQALVRDQLKSPAEFDQLLRRICAFPGIDPEWRRPQSDAQPPQIVPLHIRLHGKSVRLRIPTLVMSPPRSYPYEVYPELRLAIGLPEDRESKEALSIIRHEIAGVAAHERLAAFVAPPPAL